jgi:hypothetical protein
MQMLKFYVVPTSHIQQTWNKVEIMLDRAMAHSGGEYDLDQLKVLLTQGRQILCVGTEEDLIIKCAMTIEWINYPNDRVAFITAIGGKTDKQGFGEFEQWVKANGGTKIQGAAFEAVARLWKRAYGFENRYIIVEKQIT